MDEANDTHVSAETSQRTPLQQRIETQRAQLLQAHVAANLVNDTAEELDSVHIGPLVRA